MFRFALGVALVIVAGSCRRDGEPPQGARAEATATAGALLEGSAAPSDQAERAAVERARAASKTLLQTLKGRLSTVMNAEGLLAAANVCAVEAQRLTTEIAEREGVVMGRSSAKLRNPSNAGPPWVTAWLAAHEREPATEVTPAVGIVSTDAGAVARVITPIGLEPLCLNCHGPKERIPAEVQQILDEHYPNDAATGYAVGELRGAAWAEVPVRPG